jgi:hypothetical protein
MKTWSDKRKSWDDDTITSSEARFGGYRLTVHRHIDYPPDVWLASCTIFFNKCVMQSKDLDGAKKEAMDKLRKMLKKTIEDLNKAIKNAETTTNRKYS